AIFNFLLTLGHGQRRVKSVVELIQSVVHVSYLLAARHHTPQSLGRTLTALRERTVRICKVVSSIPIRPTKTGNCCSENCGDFSFDHRNTTDLTAWRALPLGSARLFCFLRRRI